MHRQRIYIILCLLLSLGGCGGTEYSYRDGRDQKEGPGLMSGEDGVFSVYNSGGDAGVEESRQKERQPERKSPQ